MPCIGLLGCRHAAHRSAKDYILMALMVVAIIFGLRILTYIIARCMMISRRREPESRAAVDHEFEMRVASAALAMHRHHEWRRQAVEAAEAPPTPAGEWQSKLVIAAGCDGVSYIAHPRPLSAERLG